MRHNLIFLAILLPLAGGLAIALLPREKSRKILFIEVLGATALCALAVTLTDSGLAGVLELGPFAFRLGGDRLGRFFGLFFALLFLLAGVFSLEYNEHDKKQNRFDLFFLLTLGSLMGLSYAQNLFTYYLFYESMTLCSMPLVFHTGDEKAMKAAVRYLGYSLFGAALVLFGFFYAGKYCDTTDFLAGGSFNGFGAEHMTMALLAAFCLLLGFGCKAGMLPLHHWLPVAHPVAPAPASAVLSAAITKAGVLGVIRGAYYVFGADLLRGTWVQEALVWLALATVFTGSMLAYREKLLKRRLAWSTVSQVSYVLYGLFLFQPQAYSGAMMQVLFHGLCKTGLFLIAGAIIHKTGKTMVYELAGLGRKMPLTFLCFALCSLSLVGIPPFAGFVSKWSLAVGGISAMGITGAVGAAVLLVSALLTAGYLFPIAIHGFAEGGEWQESLEPGKRMLIPVAVLALSLLVLGLFTGPVEALCAELAGVLYGGG